MSPFAQDKQKQSSFFVGQRCVCVLPDWQWQSLCYCLLPTASDILHGWEKQAIIVLVSPLVALMKGQVRAMAERSVRAVYVGDVKKDAEVVTICAGSYQLVFLSPEAHQTHTFLQSIAAVFSESSKLI